MSGCIFFLSIYFYKVRMHLTGGFLCVVLDLSGNLWPLLIPEYSGIKRRGTPFLGAEESRHYLCCFLIMLISTLLSNRDRLVFCKSGILICIFAENNYSIYAHTMLFKTPLLHQSFGPCVFLSFFLFLFLFPFLFLADSLERESRLHNPGNISLFPSFTFSSSTPDHQVPVH